jgi:cell division protein FtsW
MTTYVRSSSRSRGGLDPWLVYITLALLVAGLFFVFSASFVRGVDFHDGDGFYFLKRQLISVGVGAAGFLLCYFLGPRRLKWLVGPALVGTIALLVLTLLIGVRVGDSMRWLRLGPIDVQPSELAKPVIVLALAWFFTRARADIRDFWRGLVPGLLMVGAIAGLVMLGRDLGTTLVILSTTLVVLLVAGARIQHLLALVAFAFLAVYLLVFVFGYNKERIESFLGFGQDTKEYYGRDYQATHSLFALGSGGPTGVGLCRSREKYYYLPAPFTDFILSIIGEETGLVGTGAIIVLFGLLVWRGYVIACRARTPFASILAMGVIAVIAIESVINIAVVTVSIPTTGTPLPFVAYGGSSLATKLAMIGILLAIHDRPNE